MPVPLYRLQGGGDHFYTTSAEERDNAIAKFGYTDEGIACYVSTTAAPDLTSLRDSIASTALAAIINCNMMGETSHPREVRRAAVYAYRYADAMLAAR